MTHDTENNPIQPGALYCERFTNYYGTDAHKFDQLVWAHSNGQFFDADNGLPVSLCGDSLQRQITDLNPAYITTEQMGATI